MRTAPKLMPCLQGTTITQKSFLSDFGLATMTKSQRDAVSSNLTSIYSVWNSPIPVFIEQKTDLSCPTVQAGGFFGALFAFFVLELMGRKPTLIISNVIFVIGA